MKYYPESRFLKPNQDGGDALHRYGMCGMSDAITLKGPEWINAQREFAYKIDQFYFDGHYHRFYRPTFTDWWMKVGVSPDQLRSVIAALGLFKLWDELDEIEHYLRIHKWWATNTYVNGPERVKKLLPDHAFTLRGVIDRARGQKTKWVEMNDRIALAEVTIKTNLTCAKGKARIPIKKRKIVNWTYKEEFVRWHFPLGRPKHDADPTNRVVLMVQSQYCDPEAKTSTAAKARKMYGNAKIIVPTPDLKNYNEVNYAHHSWTKYWVRPTDRQCENIYNEWKVLVDGLKR